jgi:hypothetical protein
MVQVYEQGSHPIVGTQMQAPLCIVHDSGLPIISEFCKCRLNNQPLVAPFKAFRSFFSMAKCRRTRPPPFFQGSEKSCRVEGALQAPSEKSRDTHEHLYSWFSCTARSKDYCIESIIASDLNLCSMLPTMFSCDVHTVTSGFQTPCSSSLARVSPPYLHIQLTAGSTSHPSNTRERLSRNKRRCSSTNLFSPPTSLSHLR